MTEEQKSTNKRPIALVTTGGTIDAQPYKETPDDITPLDKSLVPAVLERIRQDEGLDFNFTHSNASGCLIEELYAANRFRADSKHFLSREEYEALAARSPDESMSKYVIMEDFIEFLVDLPEDQIIITHGSDAMVKNAQTIYNHPAIKESGKTIVMVPSITPLSNSYKDGVDKWYEKPDYTPERYNFQDTEGYDNLTEAVGYLLKIREAEKETSGADIHIIANRGTFHATNEELEYTEKEFNTTRPEQRYFYKDK